MADYISSVGRANRPDLAIDNRSKKVEENQKDLQLDEAAPFDGVLHR